MAEPRIASEEPSPAGRTAGHTRAVPVRTREERSFRGSAQKEAEFSPNPFGAAIMPETAGAPTIQCCGKQAGDRPVHGSTRTRR